MIMILLHTWFDPYRSFNTANYDTN